MNDIVNNTFLPLVDPPKSIMSLMPKTFLDFAKKILIRATVTITPSSRR